MVSENDLGLEGAIGPIGMAIDDSLGSHRSPAEEAVEKILVWAHKVIGSEQLVQAKEQFYWKTGKFFPDDNFYVNRISYFIDYFIFERPLETSTSYSGKTPHECYLAENPGEQTVQKAYHSVFLVQKISETEIVLKDLMAKAKHKIPVRASERFEGILKNDIFQGFLYTFDDQQWISRSLIFHPYKAYRYIKKNLRQELKKEDLQATLVLHRLARQQLKHSRHEHVNPKMFYAEEKI